jgi:hypothetical protein
VKGRKNKTNGNATNGRGGEAREEEARPAQATLNASNEPSTSASAGVNHSIRSPCSKVRAEQTNEATT